MVFGRTLPCSHVSTLGAGVLTVGENGGAESRWQIACGFFEVSNNRATVPADAAGVAKG